ncbi:zinc-ribbon domain-containing protein [Nitrosopumilus adriaticus]|uniref:Zinc-ribbon domain-containing protein n=1 Tax=Nitrosopumilus adriaticus TaxID=1580092 RepID=A0A0D5C2Z2_9ARCH|nr:zinc-ribbon domain-containing protein [Nitrosopumilus adriaticus]AJW71086.1 hypothetical protein NADRNF5_1401 [Nitrosopumilus adriaticus]
MEPSDIVDEVNALLKLRVGDAYRLEHIKQAYIENKTIWVTDQNYLQRMKEKYLNKQQVVSSPEDNESSDEFENKETIHCWKCGKKTPLGANFCMLCGSSLFEVGANSIQHQKVPASINQFKGIGLKMPIIIGIPVLILIIVGGAYGLGYFDNTFERYDSVDSEVLHSKETESKTILSSTESDSKCGPGTIFDSDSNSCVLDSGLEPEENSKCGPGTIFDSDSNSCVLDK